VIDKLTVDDEFNGVAQKGGGNDAALGPAFELFPVVVLGGVEPENVYRVRPGSADSKE
jgi:hypothetical protein